MAQFKMNAEITLKANDAIKAIQNFEKGAKGSKKEFSLLGRTIALDTKRIGKNLATMTIIAGSFFAKVISQSPHLRAEFKRLQASTLLFNVALGEKLQPTVEFLVDAIIFLQQVFLTLPEPIQEVIIITGFLTLVMTSAALSVMALNVALGPITIVIIGIAFAIAAIIVVWQRWDDIMKAAKDNTLLFMGALYLLAIPFGLIILPILLIIALIKNWGNNINTLKGLFLDLLVGIGLAVAQIGLFFIDVWNGAGSALDGFIDGVWIAIHGLVNGLKGIFHGIVDPIVDAFVWVVNKAIWAYNAIPGVDNISYIGGGGGGLTAAQQGNIVDTSAFSETGSGNAEGGQIFKDGLIFAHRGEEVTTKSQTRANHRNGGTSGGMTIINKNTFNIGSVDNKSRIRQIVRDVNRAQKRDNDRRFKT